MHNDRLGWLPEQRCGVCIDERGFNHVNACLRTNAVLQHSMLLKQYCASLCEKSKHYSILTVRCIGSKADINEKYMMFLNEEVLGSRVCFAAWW